MAAASSSSVSRLVCCGRHPRMSFARVVSMTTELRATWIHSAAGRHHRQPGQHGRRRGRHRLRDAHRLRAGRLGDIGE